MRTFFGPGSAFDVGKGAQGKGKAKNGAISKISTPSSALKKQAHSSASKLKP